MLKVQKNFYSPFCKMIIISNKAPPYSDSFLLSIPVLLLVNVSGLPSVFEKSKFYLLYVNWTLARGLKNAKKDIRILSAMKLKLTQSITKSW